MARGRRTLVVMLGTLAAWGCEHGVTLSGTITVPVEVQQLFSRTRPGLVRVSSLIPKSSVGSYRVAVLCDPGDQAIVAPFHHDGFGCAKQGIVRVEALRAEEGAPFPACGVGQAPWRDGSEGTAVATGEQAVFEGATAEVGCTSGTDAFEIVLRLVAAG